MWTFFLVDQATFDSTDWWASPTWSVGPALIGGGTHAGKYAVDVEIFNCSEIFEAYRTLLETFPTAECDDRDEWFPPPE